MDILSRSRVGRAGRHSEIYILAFKSRGRGQGRLGRIVFELLYCISKKYFRHAKTSMFPSLRRDFSIHGKGLVGKVRAN